MSSGLFGRNPRPEFQPEFSSIFVERSMAPLSDTAKTALVARLRMARSGKRNNEDALVQPLANHLAGRGESVADLPWDVEEDVTGSSEGWREEWLALLAEAKVESKLSQSSTACASFAGSRCR